jgi:serine/threonine protein kinase/DNA-binding response OmpR family regulator
MVTRLSGEEFLRNLGESGLFSEEEMGAAVAVLPEPPAADADVVAQRLIASGKLTPFQATAVFERHFDELVIGNYQVLDRLGAGGMGTVYKARHRRMKRVVAIKVLTRTASQSDKFVQRFQREVEAVARLSHPNIVMAHDADEAEAGHFLVMEFVNGRDLASAVKAAGPLPIPDAVDCILQAARALDYAHRQGIIHRDIKPANLLRDESGVVKVADLGLARFNDTLSQPASEASSLTQAGTIMGTADFMPPEQAMGLSNVDHRADIYSLGCTLHFLLIGHPPFDGQTIMAILLKHRDGAIPSLCAARKGVPAALDQVFQRMLAKKPEDRFASMAEVIAALESILPGPQSPPPALHQSPDEQAAAPTPTLYFAPVGHDTSSHGAGDQTAVFGTEQTPVQAGLSVLLVEPSRTQAGIIGKLLQGLGVPQIAVARSGQQALQAMRAGAPAVVVSSLHLPDMTGVQLAQRMHEEKPAAAPGFVLISSEDESAEAGSLSKCGKAVLLHKPFSSEKLSDALRLVSDWSPPGHPSGVPTAPQRNLKVLIVDDSTPARLHVCNVLRQLGLSRFVEAPDGAQAVAATAKESFDLIVTDYNMPLMDGRGLVGYLKQNPATASVPIIMVTTETDAAKLDAVRKLGVTAICDKSFQREEVGKIIDRLPRTQ